MKKIMDKFKNYIRHNKKLVFFLIIVGIIAIAAGSIFTVILNKDDKTLTLNYISEFMNNVDSNNLNYISALKNGFLGQISYIIIIWLLGMSVIGIPVILIMYFSKLFVLGFSISAIISNYGLKGCLLSFSYIFPHQIINTLIYIILTIAALKVSGKLLYYVLKKGNIDFKLIFNNYLLILLGTFILAIPMILFEVYITPKFIAIFLPLIK